MDDFSCKQITEFALSKYINARILFITPEIIRKPLFSDGIKWE